MFFVSEGSTPSVGTMVKIEEIIYVDVIDDEPMATALAKMLVNYVNTTHKDMNITGYGLLLGKKEFEAYFYPHHREVIQKVIDSVQASEDGSLIL